MDATVKTWQKRVNVPLVWKSRKKKKNLQQLYYSHILPQTKFNSRIVTLSARRYMVEVVFSLNAVTAYAHTGAIHVHDWQRAQDFD